ncbi:MAG: hypothetical protein ABI645_07785 [Pseudomonadota bacterium]
MKRILAALLVMALPVGAAQQAGCGALCGDWHLDATLSSAVGPAVDEALRSYNDPRARRAPRSQRSRDGNLESTVEQIDAAMERSLGPILDRPVRADLRSELMSLLAPPAQLNLGARGTDFLIQSNKQVARKVSPGTPKARVDANGTAKILATWKSDRLQITEKYDRKRKYFETYSLQAAGTLLVTRVVERPGMKSLRIQSVYRRT